MDILERIGSLAKRRGFLYPGSELYGGLAGTWDYGPLGTELKRNIKNAFWRSMVQERDDVVGIDAAILMNPRVWEASGHLESFNDPLVECTDCRHRFDAGKLTASTCPDCGGTLTEPKQFNLMMETALGSVEGEKQRVFLRGEITQGVHVNFKQVLDSTRVKLPFGIAQIGKAFRNEISPGTLSFRSREFEQMELQFYVPPQDEVADAWITTWREARLKWYTDLGMDPERLRISEHGPNELAHYARAAWDIEFHVEGDFWGELEGIHNRGDWDLSRHQEYSGEDLRYFDDETKEKYLPWIIETSGGVDRATLFFLMSAYHEESTPSGDSRTVLRLHPALAPYKVAVFPLLANKPELVAKARELYDVLKLRWMTAWDDRGNIGKRYRSQDEAGTPYCITVDFDTLEKGMVTVRDRDTMTQETVAFDEIETYLTHKLG